MKPISYPGCPSSGNDGFEAELLKLINQEQARQGLGELSTQAQLVASVRAHSREMACLGYFSYSGANGSGVDDRIMEQGFPHCTVGGNIFAGKGPFNSPEKAFSTWMNSSGHKQVMLHPEFTKVGIGYIYNPESYYGGYFTADFASA